MESTFREQLISRKVRIKDWILFIFGITVALCLYFVSTSMHVSQILPVAVFIISAFLLYLFYSKIHVEFEYILVNGELDVDIIYNKSRRKHLVSFHLKDIEYMDKTLDFSKQFDQKGLVKFEFFSGNLSCNVYSIVVNIRGIKHKITIEPNESILSEFARIVPRDRFLRTLQK